MLLVPDDGLREVQTVLGKERRIVSAICIATPDIETSAGHQHASNVAEPSIKQSIELFIAHKVIRKRSILRAKLLVGGCILRLARFMVDAERSGVALTLLQSASCCVVGE